MVVSNPTIPQELLNETKMMVNNVIDPRGHHHVLDMPTSPQGLLNWCLTHAHWQKREPVKWSAKRVNKRCKISDHQDCGQYSEEIHIIG